MRCEVIDAPIGARPRRNDRACVACGCTDDRACPGGCSWFSRDLCSACVSPQDLADVDAVAADDAETFFGEERCPASTAPALHAKIWLDDTSGYCARCRQGFTT